MESEKYARYLLTLLLSLQIIGLIIFFVMWINFDGKGILLATLVLFKFNAMAISNFQKMDVYDADGRTLTMREAINTTNNMVVILGIMCAMSIIIGCIIGNSLAVAYNKDREYGLFIPFLSTLLIYGALSIVCMK
jgi:hypothetical protein